MLSLLGPCWLFLFDIKDFLKLHCYAKIAITSLPPRCLGEGVLKTPLSAMAFHWFCNGFEGHSEEMVN